MCAAIRVVDLCKIPLTLAHVPLMKLKLFLSLLYGLVAKYLVMPAGYSFVVTVNMALLI